jgi:hypothetical protein
MIPELNQHYRTILDAICNEDGPVLRQALDKAAKQVATIASPMDRRIAQICSDVIRLGVDHVANVDGAVNSFLPFIQQVMTLEAALSQNAGGPATAPVVEPEPPETTSAPPRPVSVRGRPPRHTDTLLKWIGEKVEFDLRDFQATEGSDIPTGDVDKAVAFLVAKGRLLQVGQFQFNVRGE